MAKQFAAYADKAPTSNHEAFAEWIEKQTGVQVDAKSVQLALLLVPQWQKSPENHARRDKSKAAQVKKSTVVAKKSVAKKAPAAKAPAKSAKVTPISAAKKSPAKKAVRRPATKPAGEAAF